jgi:hypothetical protein
MSSPRRNTFELFYINYEVMHYDRRSGRAISDKAGQLRLPYWIGGVTRDLTSYTFAAKLCRYVNVKSDCQVQMLMEVEKYLPTQVSCYAVSKLT